MGCKVYIPKSTVTWWTDAPRITRTICLKLNHFPSLNKAFITKAVYFGWTKWDIKSAWPMWNSTIINNPWMFCSIPMKQIRILLGWRSNKTEFLKRSLPNGPSQTLRCVIPGIPQNSAGWAAWSLRKLPQNRPHKFWWWDPTFLGGYVRLQFFWGGRMTRLDGAKHFLLNWVETTT